MQKQLEGTQKYINELVDRAANIDKTHAIIVIIHTRFQRSINA